MAETLINKSWGAEVDLSRQLKCIPAGLAIISQHRLEGLASYNILYSYFKTIFQNYLLLSIELCGNNLCPRF